jgi:hypothetical protein
MEVACNCTLTKSGIALPVTTTILHVECLLEITTVYKARDTVGCAIRALELIKYFAQWWDHVSEKKGQVEERTGK